MDGRLCAAPCGFLLKIAPSTYLCARGVCPPSLAGGPCVCRVLRVPAPGELVCPQCGARRRMARGMFAFPTTIHQAHTRPRARDMAHDPTRVRRLATCPACGVLGVCVIFMYPDVVMRLVCVACDHEWNPEQPCVDRAFSAESAAGAGAAFASPVPFPAPLARAENNGFQPERRGT